MALLRPMAPAPGEVRVTLVKAAALLAFIVAGDVWATHQFGLDLTQLLAVGGVVTLVSTSVLPFAKAILSADEQKAAVRRLRNAGRVVLWTPLLVFLYVGGGIVALTVSSVTVTGEGSDRADSVSIAYLDRPSHMRSQLLYPDSTIRFPAVTTPLGRRVRVAAPGFIAASFTVYPLTGLTVSLGSDLPVAPSILFRPEAQGLLALRNKGRFRAWTLPRTDPAAVLAETSGVVSSFLVGEPRALPAGLLETWKLELGCDTTGFKNNILFAWARPTPLGQRAGSPGPGTRLHAEIVARSGAIVAQSEVQLGADRLIDIPVLDLTPDATSCR